jgi:hypothetical protein
MDTQKYYKCTIYEYTFDCWEWEKASSPALAALQYYEGLKEGYKDQKIIYVLEAEQNHMVDTPKVFYM